MNRVRSSPYIDSKAARLNEPFPLLCKQQGQLNTGIELAIDEMPEQAAQSMLFKCLQADNHFDVIKPEGVRRLELQGDLIACVICGDNQCNLFCASRCERWVRYTVQTDRHGAIEV